MKKLLAVALTGMILTTPSLCSAKTRLTLMSPYGAGPYQEAWESVAEKYKKVRPDVEIKVIPDTWAIVDKLIAQAAAGTGPDMAIITESYVGKLGWQGFLENLEPYMKRSKFPEAQYYKAPMDAYKTRYKGVRGQFGLPIIYSGYGFYFNKDMFAKRGLAVPKNDWNTDDFKQYVTKLTLDQNGDGKNEQYALDIQFHQNRMIGFIRSFGGDIINEEKDELKLDDPQSIAGLQYFGDLWAKYKAVQTGGFAGNLCAMYSGSAFGVNDLRKVKFDFDAIPYPVGPKTRSVALPTAGIAMMRLSKNKDEAWRFMQYFMSKEIQEHIGRLQIAIPVHTAASKAWLNLDAKPKNGEVFIDSVKYARPTGIAPYMDDVFAAVVSIGTDLTSNKSDAATLVKKITPQISAILKKYKTRMSR